MGQFDARKYATVAERLTEATPLIRSVTTEPPVLLTDTMGYIRATVVLTNDRIGMGTASFRLDLTTRSAQATNPIEDCETSAVGRALAMLGYAADKSIASAEEVAEARAREGAMPVRPPQPGPRQQPGASFAPRGRSVSGAANRQPVETIPVPPRRGPRAGDEVFDD